MTSLTVIDRCIDRYIPLLPWQQMHPTSLNNIFAISAYTKDVANMVSRFKGLSTHVEERSEIFAAMEQACSYAKRMVESDKPEEALAAFGDDGILFGVYLDQVRLTVKSTGTLAHQETLNVDTLH